MNKKQLIYIRIPALILSCFIAFLSLGNFLTVVTHSINIDIPEEHDVSWAIDPVNKELLFLTDFTINNQGAYDIDDIDISAKLVTENGKKLIDYNKDDLVVKRGSNKTFEIKIKTSFNDLNLIDLLEILYKNSVFKLFIDINACYMFGLIDVNVDEIIEHKWWAPLGNISQDDYIVKKLFNIIPKLDNKNRYEKIDINDFSFIDLICNQDLKTDWNYDIFIDVIDDIKHDLKTISFGINTPIDKIDGNINIGFKILFHRQNDNFDIKLKEVNIGYVAN
jgi:hypothetical protein